MAKRIEAVPKIVPQERPYLPFFLGQRPPLISPTPVRPFKDMETDELYSHELAARFGELCRRANDGEADALAWLLDLATKATGILNRAADNHTDKLKPRAAHRYDWPVLLTPMQCDRESLLKFFEKLELGTKSVLGIEERFYKKKQKGWDYKTPRNSFALRVLIILSHNRRDLHEVETGEQNSLWNYDNLPQWVVEAVRLPPFSHATLKQWLDVGWKMILHSFDGHPEKEAELRSFGLKRGKRGEKGSGSEAAHQRDGIKNALREGLTTLAPHKLPVLTSPELE